MVKKRRLYFGVMVGSHAWRVVWRITAVVAVLSVVLGTRSAEVANIRLDAHAEDGAVAVELEASTGSSKLNLTLTHEDPLAGTVVARIVPVTLDAGTRLLVKLEDLRVGVNFTLRILDASIALSLSLDGTARLPNATLVNQAPTLAQIEVPALSPLARNHTNYVRGYRVMPAQELGGVSSGASLLVTDAGFAAVLYADANATLKMRVSYDGGHHFTNPLEIASSHTGVWAEPLTNDRIAVIYGSFDTFPDGTSVYRQRIAIVDAADPRVLSDEAVGEGQNLSFSFAGLPELRGVPGGGALLMFNGSVLESNETKHIVREWRFDNAFQLWQLDNDGRASFLGVVRPPAGMRLWDTQFSLAVSATGEVMAVGVSHPEPGVREQLWGARFPLAQGIAVNGTALGEDLFLPNATLSIGGLGNWEPLALDGVDAAHVVVDVSPPQGAAESYYVRIPVTGSPSAIRLGDLVPQPYVTSGGSQLGRVLVQGLRVWLFWNSFGPIHNDLWGVESVNAGVTFGPPYRIRDRATGASFENAHNSPQLFPDGRALMLSRIGKPFPENATFHSIPVFDPVPGAESGLVVVLESPTQEELLPEDPTRPLAPPSPLPLPPLLVGTPEEQRSQGGQAALAAGASFGAVALVTGAVFATEAGRTGLLVSLAPLFTRLQPSDILTHDVRASVFAAIRNHPGIRFTELRKDLGISNGAMVFHLRVLQREGYVVSRVAWTKRIYYASGSVAPSVSLEPSSEVATLLASSPALSQSEIARRFGISRQLARYHLRALERAGRVEAQRKGREVRYRRLP